MAVKCFLEHDNEKYRNSKNMARGKILKEIMESEGKSVIIEHCGVVI